MPTVSAGYGLIVEAVEEALRETRPGSRDERVLSEIATHFREEILGEETEVKTLVRELWKVHGRALHLALEHRPRLEDIRSLYEALLRERFGDDAYTYYWKTGGELREIKASLHSWENAGCPFEFMLFAADGSPMVRLLIWGHSYNAHAESLRDWAREVNASAPAMIDEEFTKLPHWPNWRRVFLEEAHPAEAILDEQAFDEATARAAVEAVARLYEKLQPHIKTAGTPKVFHLMDTPSLWRLRTITAYYNVAKRGAEMQPENHPIVSICCSATLIFAAASSHTSLSVSADSTGSETQRSGVG